LPAAFEGCRAQAPPAAPGELACQRQTLRRGVRWHLAACQLRPLLVAGGLVPSGGVGSLDPPQHWRDTLLLPAVPKPSPLSQPPAMRPSESAPARPIYGVNRGYKAVITIHGHNRPSESSPGGGKGWGDPLEGGARRLQHWRDWRHWQWIARKEISRPRLAPFPLWSS
jgi:hypothetical protein